MYCYQLSCPEYPNGGLWPGVATPLFDDCPTDEDIDAWLFDERMARE
jgi:hypothetical protein